MSEKVVIFHGFSKEELNRITELLKKSFPGQDIIMAITTPTSLQWKVGELISELKKEHEYFKKKR